MKSKKVLTSVFALLVSASVLTACNAPGSSKPISSGGKDIKVTQPGDGVEVPGLPTNPIIGGRVGGIESLVDSGDISNPKERNFIRSRSLKFISKNQSIKYVAFGDSLTAGFDGTLPKDYKGKLEVDGSISGLSYPSFLARMLNVNGRVQSYDNFAVSGSRVLDWIKLFEMNYDGKDVSDKVITSIFPNKEEFKNEVKSKLAEANLVTFTLGANDLFSLILDSVKTQDALKIVKKFLDKKPLLNDAIIFFNNLFKDSLPEIRKRLITFISNLKTLAPKANINLISYPIPMQLLFNVLNKYVSNQLLQDLVKLDASNIFIEIINDNLQEVAEITSINFIQTYNNKFWNANVKDLSSIYLDIHPGTKGYKKIALDLYLKITKPYLNLKYYEGYDFDKDYILKDAASSKYQIEVGLSDKEAIGASNTFDYLNHEIADEIEVKTQRSPFNFGKRISELSNIFQYLVVEFVEFLTDNAIYNELDPERKLKQLLVDNNHLGTPALVNLVQEVMSSGKLESIFANIQNQLSASLERGDITFEKFTKIFIDNFVNLDNIAYLIKVISKSQLLSNNKEELANVFKTIIDNFIRSYSAKVSEIVEKPIFETVGSEYFEEGEITSLVAELLGSQDFVNLIKKFVDVYIYNSEDFAEIESINDFILSFFKNQANNREIATLINQNLQNVLENKKVKQIFGNLLHNVLKSKNLTNQITKEQIVQAVDDLLSLANGLNNEFDLTNVLIKNLLNELPVHGITNFSQLISNSLKATFNEVFGGQNFNKNFVALVKTFSNSDLIENNKPLLKQLVTNYLESQSFASLSTVVRNAVEGRRITRYFSAAAFERLSQVVFGGQYIKNLFSRAVDSTIENHNAFKNVTSTNEIIIKVLEHTDLDEVKNNISGLINSIKDSKDFPYLIKDIFTSFFTKYNIPVDPRAQQFFDDLSNDAKAIIDDLNFIEPFITDIFDFIKTIRNSENAIEEFDKLPDIISKSLSKHLLNDPIGLIKKLVAKPYVRNNVDAIALLSKVVFNDVKARGYWAGVVEANIDKVLKINDFNKYVDKDEVRLITLMVVNNENLGELLEELIKTFINNQSLLDKVTSPRELFDALITNRELKNTLIAHSKPIVKEVLASGAYKRSIAKAVIETSKGSFFEVDEKYKVLFENATRSIIEVLNATNKFDQFIDAIFEVLAGSENIEEIVKKLPSKMSDIFDLSISEIYRAVLNSTVLNFDRDLLKEFLKEFITRIQDNKFVNTAFKLLPDKFPYSLTKDEVKATFTKVTQNEDFRAILDKSVDFMFANLDRFKESTSAIDNLNIVLADKDYLETVKSHLKAFISAIKDDTTIKKIVVNLILSFETKEEYSWILNEVTNKERFIENVYSSLLKEFDHLNVIPNLFKGLESFSKLNVKTPQTLTKSIVDEFVAELKGRNLESNFTRVLRSLSNEFFRDNSQNIVQVVKNIYNHYLLNRENLESVLHLVNEGTNNSLSNLTEITELTELAINIFEDQEIKNYISGQLTNLVSNENKFSQVQNFNEILKVILINLDKEQLKSLIKNLFDKVKTNPTLRRLVAKILTNYIKQNHPSVYDEVQTSSFFNNLLTDIFKLEEILDIKDQVVDKFIEAISLTNTNDDLNQKLKNFVSEVSDIFVTRAKEKMNDIISFVFRSNVFTHNKPYTLRLIKFFAEHVIENTDLLWEPINSFLSTNNLIDTNRKLNKEQFDKLRAFILHVNNYSSTSTIINNVLSFTDEEVSKIVDLETFKNVIGKKAINALNLSEYQLLKAILSSDYLSSEREFVKHVLEKVLNKYLTQETINSLLENASLNSLSSSLGIQEANLKSFITKVLTNDKIKDVIKIIADHVLSNLDSLRRANSYNDLIKQIFLIENLKPALREKLIALINDVVNNDKFKKDIKSFILSVLNNELFSVFFKGVQNKQRIADNIIEVYDIFDNNLSLNQIIFDTLFEHLKENGYQFNITSLLSSFGSSLKDRLNSEEGAEAKVVKMVKELVNSKLLNQNKEDLSRIIVNALESLGNKESFNKIIDSLSKAQKDKITQYIQISDLKVLLNFVLGNTHFHSILDNLIKRLFDNLSTLNDVTSYFDIIKRVLAILDLESLETHVLGLMEDILSRNEVNDSVYRLLKQTLGNFGVNTNDGGIDVFIRDLSRNLETLLNQTDLLKPIIKKFFEKLKHASRSNNKEELINALSTISVDIVKIIKDKVISDPKSFVDNLLEIQFIKDNKPALIKTIAQLLIGLKDKGTLKTIVYGIIDDLNLSADTLEVLDKTTLKKLVDIVLSKENLNNLITNIVPELLNDTNWLNHINDPFTLIKSLMAKPNVLRLIKSFINSFVDGFVSDPKTPAVMLRLVENFARKYDINLRGFDKTVLIRNVTNSIIPFAKDIDLYPRIIDIVAEQIKVSLNVNDLLLNVKLKLSKSFDLTDYKYLKAFLNRFSWVTQSKSEVSAIALRLFDKFMASEEWQEALVNQVLKVPFVSKYGVRNSDIKLIIKALKEAPAFETGILIIITHILNNWDTLKEANSYSELFDKLINIEPLTNTLKRFAEYTIKTVLESRDFSQVGARIFVTEINKTKYKTLLKDITNPENLISNIFGIISVVNKNLSISDNIIDEVFKKLQANETIDTTLLTNSLQTTINKFINNPRFEANLINLLKEIVKTEGIRNNKSQFGILFKNTLDLLFSELNPGQLVWQSFNDQVKAFINEHFVSGEQFANVINDFAQLPDLRDLIGNLTNYFIDNIDDFNEVTTISGLMRTYFRNQNNETSFKNNLKQIITKGLSKNNIKSSLRSMLNKLFRFINVHNNQHAEHLINVISNDFGDLLNRSGVFDQTINILIEEIKNNEGINDVLSHAKDRILNELTPANFNFIKKLINDPLVQNNKEKVLSVVLEGITNFLNDETKIRKVINDLNLASLLVTNEQDSPINLELINNMIVLAIKNPDLRDALKISINDFIQRANVYNQNQSWLGALNTLLKTPSSAELKTKFTRWIKATLTNPDTQLVQGAAQFLISKLRNSGFMLETVGDDHRLLSNIINSFFRTLAERPELNKIIDKIYENIKAIDFSKGGRENIKLVKDAISNGAFSLILTEDNRNISFSKVLSQYDFLKYMLDRIGDNNYVTFITRLFESSDRKQMTGIYATIKNQLIPGYNSSHSSNETSSSSNNGGGSQSSDSYGFTFDESIFTVVERTKKLISLLFRPIYRDMIYQAAKGNYNFDQPKANMHYKAIFRLSTLMLWYVHDKAVSGFKFWNGTSLDVETIFVSALDDAFLTAKGWYPNQFNSLPNWKKQVIGADWRGNYNWDFVVGNRSISTNLRNYWKDQLFAYIYYRKNNLDRHTGKTMTDALLDALKKGSF